MRTLFSHLELGIDNYCKSRAAVKRAIPNAAAYKNEIKSTISNQLEEITVPSLELKLKNFIHLITNDEDDLALLLFVMKLLVNKRIGYDGDKYRFDTILMRMFYHLNMPDDAIRVRNKFIVS